jgi:ATP phosphoribosyltransferase
VELIEITESGTAAKTINGLTDLVKVIMSSTAGLYTAQQDTSHHGPGYIVLEEKQW